MQTTDIQPAEGLPDHLPYTAGDAVKVSRAPWASFKRWTERRLLPLDAYAHAESGPDRAWLRYSATDVIRIAVMAELVRSSVEWQVAAYAVSEIRAEEPQWMSGTDEPARLLILGRHYGAATEHPVIDLLDASMPAAVIFELLGDPMNALMINVTAISRRVRNELAAQSRG